MFCPNCGAVVKDDSVFCGNCGAKITAQQDMPKTEAIYEEPQIPAYEEIKVEASYEEPQQEKPKGAPAVDFSAVTAPPEEIKDMKTLSIILLVAAFLCCGGLLPAAAAGGMWYFNSEALKLLAAGDEEGAIAKNKTAKILMYVTFGLMVVGGIMVALSFLMMIPAMIALIDSMMIVL